eukprot:TRINITY_DN6176_c0_g1_i2.p1 TRINITY_DN6176_c0_g1~~TRINITY_DN6176_c0_g1_i2.p1  ORF type:complete len:311 (+),score=106.54 TRINITY_DN6176_c0_g1_i2:440-1372(+)
MLSQGRAVVASFHSYYPYCVHLSTPVKLTPCPRLQPPLPSSSSSPSAQPPVVTGASDGIGAAYAMEFARNGLNVMLVARTKSKLDAVAEQIRAKYPKVETKVVCVDYASDADIEAHPDFTGDLDIGVLVNNVGMSYDHPEYFADVDYASHERLIDINCKAATAMTYAVLPGMVRRRRGAILNVTSAAGHGPSPLLATYSASKAYINAFSGSIAAEYASKGIHCQLVTPYFVVSKLSKIRKPSLTTPTPANFARSSVAKIGAGDAVVPFWSHALQHFVMMTLPESISIGFVRNMHLGIRKRAHKKKGIKSQ